MNQRLGHYFVEAHKPGTCRNSHLPGVPEKLYLDGPGEHLWETAGPHSVFPPIDSTLRLRPHPLQPISYWTASSSLLHLGPHRVASPTIQVFREQKPHPPTHCTWEQNPTRVLDARISPGHATLMSLLRASWSLHSYHVQWRVLVYPELGRRKF